ncbi:MAG: acetyl-coenzyme A synthetase N-terminal domain-containing protein, partial [Methanomicrobiales archaeon]|nr:acetyl-coenzyme A synthetase N-terminal domain-containing protein [Methanomicrobiales archaeon]MDI6877470.1 acetyl-coenzyme A synthetase N-terminal domain-containing protein [Methanomicrobiales archaeon]
MANNFDVRLVEETRYYSPDPQYRKAAWVQDYEETYRGFLEDPDAFWDRAARELDWFAPYERVKDWQYPH